MRGESGKSRTLYILSTRRECVSVSGDDAFDISDRVRAKNCFRFTHV